MAGRTNTTPPVTGLCQSLVERPRLSTGRWKSPRDERARQVLYTFQDPANPDVRVVLIDNFGGYADRAAENKDIVEMIPLVITTFEFASTGPA